MDTRTPGEKQKRDTQPDSTEKAQTHKKSDMTASPPVSDLDLASSPSTLPGSQRSAKPQMTDDDNWLNTDFDTILTTDPEKSQEALTDIPRMLENFSELFCTALTDSRTTNNLQNIFRPLLTEQTNRITNELKEMKEEIVAQKDEIKHMQDEILELQNTCDHQKNQITMLSDTVSQQQRFLERIDTENRKLNMIMTGIADSKDIPQGIVTEKAKDILNTIGIDKPIQDSIKFSRINSPSSENAVIKMVFTKIEDKDIVKIQARQLKNFPEYKNIYIKPDKSQLASKEDYRLRQRRRQLISENPTSKITLYKGTLSKNGEKIDEFNIMNQVFRAKP